ncbi:hypothetical protein A3709_02290 [Halioglobus sp. HI00S01]|nr:hypothetical protein A3709_02290 [Halioglobus sp. HI00S01]
MAVTTNINPLSEGRFVVVSLIVLAPVELARDQVMKCQWKLARATGAVAPTPGSPELRDCVTVQG